MAEVITTLHPENDDTIDLYPNIKKENIPANAIETSKIANEAVTENKLDPALQARLADEVVIVELSGTSGVISESSFNKLVNAEIGLIKLDNELYYKAYIKEMGSPAYPVYHFVILNQYAVNESNNDYLVRKDIAVNSSTRYWVKYTDTKSLTFYNEATETILIDHINAGDIHSDGAIDTDAGITAETESNIAGVVMDDGDVYANEVYLGDGEAPLSNSLENLAEYDNDNFYHLGEWDSIAQEFPTYVIVNRYSGYVDLGDLDWSAEGSGANDRATSSGIADYINRPASSSVKADIISNKFKTVTTDQLFAHSENNIISVSNGGVIWIHSTELVGLSNAETKLKLKGVVIQFKYNSTYQYQEQLILKRPLNTLNQSGSKFLYNEWLKTLNIWDEQWELGIINNSGVPQPANDRIRSKNYCDCLPNTNYYGKNGSIGYIYVYFYDEDNDFISYVEATNKTFTSPNNAYYFKIALTTGYGATYNHDICIFESNHVYPYQKHYGKIIHEVDIEPVTLWTNPSPNVDFGGQITVSDMSIYKYIVIEYKDDPASTTASKYLKCKYEAGKAFYIEHPDGMRLVDFLNSTTIDFDFTASYIIPVAIYGTNIL